MLRENQFSDDSSENNVSHNKFQMCRGRRRDGGAASLEKYCGLNVFVCHNELVSECRAGLCVFTGLCAHRNTYMHVFLSALYYLYASHMVFIDECPCYTAPAPSPFLCLSLCADGEGMMECWRVNLWFPGSWSGFIRSGCDNTPADGPTKRLSYKR